MQLRVDENQNDSFTDDGKPMEGNKNRANASTNLIGTAGSTMDDAGKEPKIGTESGNINDLNSSEGGGHSDSPSLFGQLSKMCMISEVAAPVPVPALESITRKLLR